MKQENSWGDVRGFEDEQISGGFISARAVFAGGIVPELVGGNFAEEIICGSKDLGIEELGFDGVVDAFAVGVGVGTGGGIEAMLGLMFLLDRGVESAGLILVGVAVELGAQIGGEDNGGGIQAMRFEVLEKAVHGQGGIGFGEFVAVSQELSPTGKFADGILKTREAVGPHLGPVEGNVSEVFDIHLEAGKGRVGGFNRAQVVLTVVAAFGRAQELMLAEDAIQSIVADFESKFCDEPAGTKAGGFLAQCQGLGFHGWGGFMRTGMRGATVGQEALMALVLVAAEPFADGVAGALVEAGGGLDAVFERTGYQVVALGESGVVSAEHGVVSLGDGQRKQGVDCHTLVSPEVRRRCPSY